MPARARSLEAWIGAGAGALWFGRSAAVPALAYGQHMGQVTGELLFGAPVEPEALRLFMGGGAMALASLAALFLCLVLGAALGSLVGVLYRRLFAGQAAARAVAQDRSPR